MNTVKKRLENRTSAVIHALNALADMNEKGADYSDADVKKIETAIENAKSRAIEKLRCRPDSKGFKLD